MRRIGTISEKEDAERFRDFLLTQQIQSQVDAAGDEWAVWVYDEDHVDTTKQELQRFLESPREKRYQKAVVEADRIRHEKVRQEIAARKKHVDLTRKWNRPLIRQIPATITLVVISVVVSLGTRFGDDMNTFGRQLTIIDVQSSGDGRWVPADRESTQTRRSTGLAEVRRGQIWRLVTPIFIHLGPWHLLFNMYWTVVFGTLIETRQGSWALIGIVIVSAIVSNLAQYYFSNFAFGGFSGVGFALFGYLWILPRVDPDAGIQLPPNMVFMFVAWLLLCTTGIVGPIANYAHYFGLGAGMAIALGLSGWRRLRTG